MPEHLGRRALPSAEQKPVSASLPGDSVVPERAIRAGDSVPVHLRQMIRNNVTLLIMEKKFNYIRVY